MGFARRLFFTNIDSCDIISLLITRYAIVEELAQLGATVHTCARNEAELNKSLNEWNTKGYRVTGSVRDVASRAERQDLIARVSNEFNGKLNILVSDSLQLHTRLTITVKC